MGKVKILLVEDDTNLGQVLSEYLRMKGFEVELSENGEEGFEAFKSSDFDVCILDIMMPRMDGFTLARQIKQVNDQIPLIFLTAKSMKEDAIKGLKLGADDYITKPFSMEELLLRIHAIIRRVRQMPGEPATEVKSYDLGTFTYFTDSRRLVKGDDEVTLTTKEAGLLELLCLYKNKTLPRSFALKKVWGDDSYFNARSMDVYIAKIRKYLKSEENIKIITVHGEGFKLIDEAS